MEGKDKDFEVYDIDFNEADWDINEVQVIDEDEAELWQE